MDALRLSLLIIGAVLVAGIYFWSKRSQADAFSLKFLNPSPLISTLYERFFPKGEEPPVLDDVVEEDGIEDLDSLPEFSAAPVAVDDALAEDDSPTEDDVNALELSGSAQEQISGEELLIVLRIMPSDTQPFAGQKVADALQRVGLEFGDMQIFHCYSDEDSEQAKTIDRQPVCSLANAVEPGTFDTENWSDFSSPGLTLFMQLPGPTESRAAFDKTLQVGMGLAEALDGELCDDSRSVVTAQTVSHLKEEIEAYRFKVRMAGVKQRPV